MSSVSETSDIEENKGINLDFLENSSYTDKNIAKRFNSIKEKTENRKYFIIAIICLSFVFLLIQFVQSIINNNFLGKHMNKIRIFLFIITICCYYYTTINNILIFFLFEKLNKEYMPDGEKYDDLVNIDFIHWSIFTFKTLIFSSSFVLMCFIFLCFFIKGGNSS